MWIFYYFGKCKKIILSKSTQTVKIKERYLFQCYFMACATNLDANLSDFFIPKMNDGIVLQSDWSYALAKHLSCPN